MTKTKKYRTTCKVDYIYNATKTAKIKKKT